MTALAARIAALQDAPLDELADEYTRLYGQPPRLLRRPWLFKRVAWGLQADVHGGLSKAAETRLEEVIGELGVTLDGTDPPKAAPRRRQAHDGLTVGTTLTRDWHGQTLQVRVVEGGFEHAGVVYSSLSAAARAITGARWNGRLFFGLRSRRRAR